MTTAATIYVAVAPLAACLGAGYQERERRQSNAAIDQAAVLRPGLDGLVIGICWPAVVALGVCIGVIALMAGVGRLVAAALEPKQGS